MHRSFNSFDWTSIGRSMDEYWTKYRAGIGEAYFFCLLCALFDSHCCRFMGNDFVMFLNQVRDEAVKKHHFDTFRIFLEIILAYASFCLPCIAMRDLQPAIIKPLISFLFSILTAISVFNKLEPFFLIVFRETLLRVIFIFKIPPSSPYGQSSYFVFQDVNSHHQSSQISPRISLLKYCACS